MPSDADACGTAASGVSTRCARSLARSTSGAESEPPGATALQGRRADTPPVRRMPRRVPRHPLQFGSRVVGSGRAGGGQPGPNDRQRLPHPNCKADAATRHRCDGCHGVSPGPTPTARPTPRHATGATDATACPPASLAVRAGCGFSSSGRWRWLVGSGRAHGGSPVRTTDPTPTARPTGRHAAGATDATACPLASLAVRVGCRVGRAARPGPTRTASAGPENRREN